MDKFKNKVLHMDCMDLLKQLPDESIDLVLTDPPYGIGNIVRHSNGGVAPQTCFDADMNWNKNIPSKKVFDEIFRVSKNQIIWGANYFMAVLELGNNFESPKFDEFDNFIKNNPKNWIIWDKVNRKSSFRDCELIWTSLNIESYILPFMWKGMIQGKSIRQGHTQQGNKKLNEKRYHPTQKPLVLIKHLINKYNKPEGIILDSFMGAWTTAKACQELGVDFIGCDYMEEYCEIGKQRLSHKPLFNC